LDLDLGREEEASLFGGGVDDCGESIESKAALASPKGVAASALAGGAVVTFSAMCCALSVVTV
jgi:hypothetical protein